MIRRRTKMAVAVYGCVACFAFSLPTKAESMAVEATYYGSAHEGLPTASGEPFRSRGYTAAHPTLPFGTQLKVCKDACTTVRVNDRPDDKTELDLSEGAAASIGLKDEGRGPVEVERVDSPTPATKAPEPPKEKPKTLPATGGPGL